MIKFQITEAELIVGWRCDACGMPGDSGSVVCENRYDGACCQRRICSRCLKGGPVKIDQELKARAEWLRAQAESLESEIGQFEVPPFEEWERAVGRSNAEWLRRHPQALHVVSDEDGDLPF